MRARQLQSLLRRTKRNLAEFKELGGYSEIYKYSIENNSEFWEKLARSRLEWKQDFTQVSNSCFQDGKCNIQLYKIMIKRNQSKI